MSPRDTGSCPPELYFLMSLRHCLWTAVESEEAVGSHVYNENSSPPAQ